jgi:hypothetical protein
MIPNCCLAAEYLSTAPPAHRIRLAALQQAAGRHIDKK